ncbi:hypothetical protein M3Y98_01159100 [Aphelenchoides besseyi]|nr:hypothetical protein M3Y98_01159100 [Aphelenchoides besseyi]KAI6210857.1 hypothetical protein M3Y96_00372300 [Aphelenchoides besseyi]
MTTPSGKTFKLLPEFVEEGRVFTVVDRNQKIGAETQNVRMRIDESGLLLYWDYARNRKFVFVDCIVDVRIGRNDPEEMTLVCNRDYVSAAFFVFKSDEKTVAKWADYLFKWAYWHKKQYRCVLRDLQRLFAPQLLESSSKFRTENAYEHLSCEYKKAIAMFAIGSSLKSVSTIDEMIDVYLEKVKRPEIEKIFNDLAKGNDTITAEDFCEFLNFTQRDDRLNDEIYPLKKVKAVLQLIEQIEPEATALSYRGFLKFLLGELTTDLDSTMQRLKIADMIFPLPHYYINSSHNTYLNGNQIHAAKALTTNRHKVCETNVEMYRQILLSGCRCVELDCWDGPTGPVITHGPISLQKINTVHLRDACEAIMECAFKSSEYPVILSLENHCSPPQQQQMAQTFSEVFGKHLLSEPLEGFPLDEEVLAPPPHSLKKKIMLKGSKNKSVANTSKFGSSLRRHFGKFIEEMDRLSGPGTQTHSEEYVNKRETRTDEEINSNIPRDLFLKDEAVSALDAQAELASLINYFQTSSTLNYDDQPYIMHSGSEGKIDRIITKRSTDIICLTSRRFIRCYPDLKRVDSSNFIPTWFWSSGIQMCALNFQTAGLSMQMNETLFEENGQTGYVLKAPILRQKTYKMSVHDNQILVAHRLEISIKSVQLLNLLASDRRESSRAIVHVDLYDLPNDTVIDEYFTMQESGDNFNALFPSNNFIFEKVIKPEGAMLHIRVLSETGEEIGQRFLPVHKMQSGYRHIILRNRANRSEGPASVFVKIKSSIYVPAYQEELRQQFANPLKNLKEQEEARQLFANPMKTSEKKRREPIIRRARINSESALTSSMDSSAIVEEPTTVI